MKLNLLKSSVIVSAFVLAVMTASCGLFGEKQAVAKADDLLIESVKRPNPEVFASSLKNGASPDACDKDGRPVIMLAAISDKPVFVEGLLSAGAKVNARDRNCNTALHAAAASAEPVIAEMLIKAGAEIDAQGAHEKTPLMEAARLGSVGTVKLLVEKGASLTAVDELGRTPVMHGAAARKNSEEIVGFLIGKGANPDVYDNNAFNTPMHAARAKNTKTTLMLIEKWPNPVVKQGEALLLMREAVFANEQDVVKALIARGTKISWSVHSAIGAMDKAQASGVYKAFARNGLIEDKTTPLMWAAKCNNTDMVNILLMNGADASAQDNKGYTAYDYATSTDTIRVLKKAVKK